MASWKLVDADKRHAAHPNTFQKPSTEEISRVTVGENVKLIFCFDDDAPINAERMWVLVSKVLSNGDFIGQLNNEPLYIDDLKLGDEISFNARHIIATERDI